jgi:hypothetical protein
MGVGVSLTPERHTLTTSAWSSLARLKSSIGELVPMMISSIDTARARLAGGSDPASGRVMGQIRVLAIQVPQS